jgi:hypothetical protein
VKDDFFKFPTTPHLTLPGAFDIREDKVMSESQRNEFLGNDLIVEEKVDGANLGISFDSDGNSRIQNRGSYLSLPGEGQWKKLGDWLTSRTDIFFERLTDRYIFFGEWCYARHSVFYDRLPDWFLGFDLYDKQVGRFLSAGRRDDFLQSMPIAQVPTIAQGRFDFMDLEKLLSHSKIGDQPAEGIYLRFDQGGWLAQRAKLVQPSFIQSMEGHWSRSIIKPNRLVSGIGS